MLDLLERLMRRASVILCISRCEKGVGVEYVISRIWSSYVFLEEEKIDRRLTFAFLTRSLMPVIASMGVFEFFTIVIVIVWDNLIFT
jgi:uncharacterized membrane protein YqjE